MENIKTIPKEVEQAIKDILFVRAKWETVNGIDTETKTEILRDNVFVNEDTGERITEPSADFLMSETDFEKYCNLVYFLNCKKGIDSGGPNLNFWPIQKAVYDAEDKLIDAITKDIPEYTPEVIKTVKTDLKYRAKFLSIVGL